jgi:hypothetical protein
LGRALALAALDPAAARTALQAALGQPGAKTVFRRSPASTANAGGLPEFVAASQVFAFLPHPMAPLALHTRECHRFFHDAYLSPGSSFSSSASFSLPSSSAFSSPSYLYGERSLGATALAQCLGVRLEPAPQEVAGWVAAVAALARAHARRAFYASAGLPLEDPASEEGLDDELGSPVVLPPDHLRLACHALRTLAALDPTPARADALAAVKAPNARCRPVS